MLQRLLAAALLAAPAVALSGPGRGDGWPPHARGAAAAGEALSLVQVRSRSGRGLADFRDAVVKRPTPPHAFRPIPGIEEMKDPSAQTPQAQAMACGTLNEKLWQDPTLQEPLYLQGAHLQAIKAMRDHATDAAVQAVCTHLLATMVQWNWVLARALADAGALDTIFAAMKRMPDRAEIRALSGDMGAFTDFDWQNKLHLAELGLVEYVYAVTDQHYDSTNEVAQMYNLWSTLCDVPEVKKRMLEEHGEFQRGVRAMKAHQSGTVRGEVITVHGACFMDTPDHRKLMFEAGMVPEVLGAIRDELSGAQGELDVVGGPRMFSNAIKMLQQLAGLGPSYRDQMVEVGAPEQIMAVLRTKEAGGDPASHGIFEMQHDLRSEGCGALAALLGTGAPQLARSAPSLAELPKYCPELRL